MYAEHAFGKRNILSLQDMLLSNQSLVWWPGQSTSKQQNSDMGMNKFENQNEPAI